MKNKIRKKFKVKKKAENPLEKKKLKLVAEFMTKVQDLNEKVKKEKMTKDGARAEAQKLRKKLEKKTKRLEENKK